MATPICLLTVQILFYHYIRGITALATICREVNNVGEVVHVVQRLSSPTIIIVRSWGLFSTPNRRGRMMVHVISHSLTIKTSSSWLLQLVTVPIVSGLSV